MKIEKRQFLITLFSFFTIAALNVNAADNESNDSHACGKYFYDFEAKKFPEIEQWDTSKNYNEDGYKWKNNSRLGAMLISDGFFAIPLGYGKFDIIRNGEMSIKRRCPGCGEEYNRLESCAFNNCYFQIKGRKDNNTLIIKPWKKVDDYLLVFKEGGDLAEYKNLIFDCRRLSDPPPNEDLDF